jgi:hypothetical protein
VSRSDDRLGPFGRFVEDRMNRRLIAAAVLSVAMAGGVAWADTDGPTAAQNARANVGPQRALNRPLPDVRFNASPLSDVIDFLADASGANFSVDWKALDAAHVAKDAPITLRMAGSVTLRKVLNLVLKQAANDAPLTYYVDDGVIEVTSQEAEDKVLICKTYPIQDLLFQAPDYNNAPSLDISSAGQGQSAGGGGGGGGSSSSNLFSGGTQNSTQTASTQKERADEIIKLITDTVKPELWQVNGGTATISFFRGMLIVNAPRSIHELLESQE